MIELINEQKINELKKSRSKIIAFIIVSIAVALGIIVTLFFFANRDNRHVINVVIALAGTISATLVLYLSVVSLSPLNKYLKLIKESLNGNKWSTKGTIVSINDKVTHYRDFPVIEVRVVDIEEENKEYVFYVESNTKTDLSVKENVTYSVSSDLILLIIPKREFLIFNNSEILFSIFAIMSSSDKSLVSFFIPSETNSLFDQ